MVALISNLKGKHMDEKRKAVALQGSIKTKSVDDERRIVFVASSNGLDRHYEHVDVKSLRLPLKAGGSIKVEDIPQGGVENVVDIPLMLNHSADVTDVIGSVRKAELVNDELVFEAGISSRDIAQDMLTLIDEGHLSNAFSITMIDYEYDSNSGTIYNAEVIEVSLVYRGSNKEARLLTVKSLLGETEVEEEKPTTVAEPTEEIKAEEAPVEETVVEEPVEETPAEEAAEETTESEVEQSTEPEQVEEPVEEEAEAEEDEETTNSEEKEMDAEIAKDAIVKSSPVQAEKTAENYLESKKALADFKDTVLKFHRGSNDQIMAAWAENLKSKAVTGDAILPSKIENILFKTWADQPGILGTFKQMGVRAGAVYAAETGTNATAKGHVKGATKVDQDLELVRRDLKALAIYKKLPIDLQDLFDDETGELLAFRAEELAARVAHEIAVGAIVGDSTNKTIDSGRGLYAMATDIAATSGYGADVATEIANSTSDTIITKAIKTVESVKAENGEGKVLVAGEGFIRDLRLALIGLNYPVANVEEFIGAKIFELSEISNSNYEMIAYVEGSYVLAGEANATVRTDFDLTKNQDVMLVERYVAGSATGYKTVAGYKKATSA